jgi:hypothetical protein
LADNLGRKIESDGVNPEVYGYPSGVIGFRLFPNPDFKDNIEAQERWDAEKFYSDPSYSLDPKVIRPLRVGMSCALCHVAAHPLNPPDDPEEPKWENLSAIIGNQYFRTGAVLASQVPRESFLWHYVNSQQPGTVDTSMTCTDHINNSNAMNAVFDFPERVALSGRNPAEEQAPIAQTLKAPLHEGTNPRRTPRVLMEGADSVGAWGALARVYLNIGMYWEEWNEVNNTIIGVTPQRPFQISVSRSNSVYWQVNEEYRIDYMAAYFLHKDEGEDKADAKDDLMLTQPMLLKHARVSEDGEKKPFQASKLANKHLNEVEAQKGRTVFAKHCMICHSSQQPSGFDIDFAKEAPGGESWNKAPVSSGKMVLPLAWEHWEAFKTSPSYLAYQKKALELSKGEDFFHRNNFLSNERRIPVSLLATNSARAMATNALAGEVWAEYSSETYKQLPAVGNISHFDPFTKTEKEYKPLGEGRGYYRPASLISVWATAPLLHNNALGNYISDDEAAHRVSVSGRLEMFDDAIEKLLWREKRGSTPSGEKGFRDPGPSTWRGTDPGWVFRTDVETELFLPPLHIRRAAETLTPSFVLLFVDLPWLAPLLLFVLTVLAVCFSRRLMFYLALSGGLGLLAALLVTGLVYLVPAWCLWLALLLLIASVLSLVFNIKLRSAPATEQPPSSHSKAVVIFQAIAPWVAPLALLLLSLTIWNGLSNVKRIVNGQQVFHLGPLPVGTPVNAIMNVNPQSQIADLLAVSRNLLKTTHIIRNNELKGEEALDVFNKYAGPALLNVSKCPDFVLDRGHYFGESLSDEEKKQLIYFLKTL